MYVVNVDNGGAPCAPDNSLTLGICKPAIRRKAKAGDRIVGISGCGKGRARAPDGSKYPVTAVIYAAIVERVLSWKDYAALPQYQDRMDCLYAISPTTQNTFHRKENTVLHTEDDMEKDLSGPVLLCREFRYFGKNAVPLSGVSSLLQELGSVMGRRSRVCDPSMRKSEDQKDLDKQDLAEFDKLFERLWRKETSYTPTGRGPLGDLGRQIAGRKCSKKNAVGGNGSGVYGWDVVKRCGARKQSKRTCKEGSATRTGRVAKRKFG